MQINYRYEMVIHCPNDAPLQDYAEHLRDKIDAHVEVSDGNLRVVLVRPDVMDLRYVEWKIEQWQGTLWDVVDVPIDGEIALISDDSNDGNESDGGNGGSDNNVDWKGGGF